MKMPSVSLFFGNLSIRRKIFIILMFIMVVFSLTSFLIYQFMISDLQDFIVMDNEKIVELVNNDILSELQNIKKSANTLIVNPIIKNYILPSSTAKERVALQTLMTRNLYGNLKISPMANVASIMIVKDPENYVYAHLSKTISETERSQLADYIYHRYQYGFDTSYITIPDNLYGKVGNLCYVQPLSSSLEYGINAYLVININGYFISNIIAKYYSKDCNLSVIDRTGNIIWRSSALSEDQLVQPDEPYPENGFIVRQTELGKVILLYNRIDSIGWVTELQIPLSNIESRVQPYSTVLGASLLICFLAAMAIYLAFSRMIAGRIQEMNKVIMEIQQGNMNSRFPVRYRDEISSIGSEFNTMIDQIQHMRLDAIEQQLRQRETELRALQSQINPHFLYNSLESIRMMAFVNKDFQTAQQIKILSDMFHYTISSTLHESQVTFQQELEHVKAYLDIQSFRFADRCAVEIDVNEEILPLKTLKLVLQPVVENAFIHGICSLEEGGKITIKGQIYREENLVEFTISDNGQGMSPEKLSLVKEYLSASSAIVRTTSSIGLVNLHDRLRLSFGNGYGILIESTLNEGTAVHVRFPIIEGESVC